MSAKKPKVRPAKVSRIKGHAPKLETTTTGKKAVRAAASDAPWLSGYPPRAIESPCSVGR